MIRLCVECQQPHRKVVARKLCRLCYRRHREAGTLDRFPVAVTRGYDRLPATVGVTYRQLDYWTTHGYLKPDVASPGSGTARQWPAEELAVAALMGRLTAARLPVAVAHDVARGNLVLAPGIRIVIDEEE